MNKYCLCCKRSSDNEHEDYDFYYSTMLDGNICHDCLDNGIVRECDFCYESFSYGRFTDRYTLRDDQWDYIKTTFLFVDAKCVCNMCVSYLVSSCSGCDTRQISNIDWSSDRGKYILDKRDDNSWDSSQVRSELVSWIDDMNRDIYTHYCSQNLCKICYEMTVRDKFYHPKKRTPERRFADYRNKCDFDVVPILRHVGIETEMIYDQLKEYDVSEMDEDDISYYIGTPSRWEGVYDGSLSRGGIELRTERPIRGNHIYEAMYALKRHMDLVEPTVNETCGLHIHYNALDFHFEDIKNLLYIMKGIEHVIFESLPSNRIDNRYCRKLSISYDDLDKMQSLGDLVNIYYRKMADAYPDTSKYNDARYFGLNLHSRFYMGTIEFRYHEGTTSVDDTLEWMKLCYHILRSAKLMTSPGLDDKTRKKLRDAFIDSRGVKIGRLERIDLLAGKDAGDYIENRIRESLKITK